MVSNAKSDAETASPTPDDSTQIKRKLAWRMGIAAAMIAALLGGLALFDYATTSSGEGDTSPPVFTEPVPVAKKNTTQTQGTVPSPAAETIGAPVAGEPESTSAPSNRAVAAETAPTHARSAGGRARTPAAVTPPAPAQAHGEAQQPPAVAIAEKSTTASSPRPSAVDTSAAPNHAAAESPTPTPASPAKLLSGYTVQAGGTFSDPKQAESVYDRLTQEGIPAALETRVLIGPFRTRAEAESARARLKTMGIEASSVRRSGQK